MESAASSQKEIIIKCELEDMTKHFFKDYVIVWHDPNLHTQENQLYLPQLEIFGQVEPFTEWDQASIYIRGTERICHVITSGTNGEFLVRDICAHDDLHSIYVFCQNQDYHANWTKNYPKISCLEVEMEQVLNKIEQNLLEWFKQQPSLKLNLPSFAPFFNETDKSHMNHLHRFLKVIPNFGNGEQAKHDFLALSRKIYSETTDLSDINNFEKNYKYNKETILYWYTRQSFLYKITNNCLRIATSDSIQYCRFALKDLQKAIQEQYQTQSRNFNGLLYRGSYLSGEEWSNLKEKVGREIEMHGFLSASKDKKIASKFATSDPQKVFITIIVPKGPNEEEQGFAEIEEFSDHRREKEVLFNVRSRFTVLGTEEKHSKEIPKRHLILLYGAQGFRKFLNEQNPIQEVSIPEKIVCADCKVQSSQVHEKMMFAPIDTLKNDNYYCKGCLPKLIPSTISPFLCIPLTDEPSHQTANIEIKGFLLTTGQTQIPFYGYKCVKCNGERRKLYYVCTHCAKEGKKWCEDCFERSLDCIKEGHAVILETNPFSFWCSPMSDSEFYHMKLPSISQGDLFQQGQMFFESHEYEKAIEYYMTYIEENKASGRDLVLACCYDDLGQVYKHKGEYEKALEFYFESLEIKESFQDLSHYEDQEGETDALEQPPLEIAKSVDREIYLHIADSYDSIGTVYHYLRENAKALEYMRNSLEIRMSLPGDNHLDVIKSYSCLALFYRDQKEYPKALSYYLQSLDITQLHDEEDYPLLVASLDNVGSAYRELQEFQEALKYFVQAMKLKVSFYGDNHPDAALSMHNIGLVYLDQQKYSQAIDYLSNSLHRSIEIYGTNHPDVAQSFDALANAYIGQREWDKALETFLRALHINRSVYGEDHPRTAEIKRKIDELKCLKRYLPIGI